MTEFKLIYLLATMYLGFFGDIPDNTLGVFSETEMRLICVGISLILFGFLHIAERIGAARGGD